MLGKNEATAQKQGARALERLSAKLRRPLAANATLAAILATTPTASGASLKMAKLSADAITGAEQISLTQSLTYTLQLMLFGSLVIESPMDR